MRTSFLLVATALLLFAACRPDAAVPSQSTPAGRQAAIYPDYRDIVIPPNIAPLNFQVKEQGGGFVASLRGSRGGEELVASAGEDGKLRFDTLQWHALLRANRGGELAVTIYADSAGQWLRYDDHKLRVAEEPIDRFLTYRLIEPGYQLYRQLGIYQRDLTGFGVRTVYENNRTFDEENNHCINCHHFQAGNAERMLFHVRAAHGGTVVAIGDKVEKLAFKSDSILSGAVYPAWHPSENLVAFSSNQTGQVFHMRDRQKVEVLDYGSDLVLYDADRHTVRNIFKTETVLETFPCWSPDGRRLYYCAAAMPEFAGKSGEDRTELILAKYDSVHYSLMSVPFDPASRRFGQPRVELDCDSLGRSATLPRVSPDGRYLLFTLGAFGQFHIWHKSSDLWLKDLRDGTVRPLSAANSADVDSYHSWSSNGRWIVFSSRRDDGSYTRPYIAYFDSEGRDHKAFLLPQEDPEQNILLLKSYNIPELSRNAVGPTAEEFREVIYGSPREVEFVPAVP